jgi:hypothetical protein
MNFAVAPKQPNLAEILPRAWECEQKQNSKLVARPQLTAKITYKNNRCANFDAASLSFIHLGDDLDWSLIVRAASESLGTSIASFGGNT